MEDNKRKRVFISYSYEDRDNAELIADRLKSAGIDIFIDYKGISVGDKIFDELKYLFQASDFVLILLSKSIFKSPYFHFEYSQDFFRQAQQRKIAVIPILIEKCNIPSDFLEYNILNLTANFDKGIEKLIERIRIIPEISFNKLGYQEFENMVYDLIKSYGFKNIQREQRLYDRGIDFIAEYFSKNPFGQKKKEIWMIETKLYSESRFDIRTIKNITDSYRHINKEDAKLLLITNGQLNSIIKDYLEDFKRNEFLDIEVIDGLLLKQLIANKRGILNKYFLK